MRQGCTPTARLLSFHMLAPTNAVVACYRWMLIRPLLMAQHP